MTLHEPTSADFVANSHEALQNANLQSALRTSRGGFVSKRTDAVTAVPEFDQLRERGRAIKDHVLANLGPYLEEYERKVLAAGGHVHWAETAADAQTIVLDICRKARARTINKGKTMISEECNLNAFLESNGIKIVETDLGEYIIQLRGEVPSHIIAPAVHVTEAEVADAFRKAHVNLPIDRDLSGLDTMLLEARTVLREKYFEAEVGITGANMLVVETGQSVIATNEGNGDLSQSLPRIHIVLASIEKIVPTLDDASTILRILGRSATGQEITVYTTFSSGPRRAADADGPEEYHVVLLDNGRTNMLGTEFQDMLRCIRCGACMNHCPVYQAVGGHAYGWVYPGPMGAVLTPSLIGVEAGGQLPKASTFCGRCEEVCPMKIPSAQDDAALARAGIREALVAPCNAMGPGVLGVFRSASPALPPGQPAGAVGVAPLCRPQGSSRLLAACRRLDAVSRHADAAGPEFHGPDREPQALSARDRILSRVTSATAALSKTGLPPARSPAMALTEGPARIGRFMAKVERSAATISRIASISDLPAAIGHELRQRNLPASIRHGQDPLFRGIAWGAIETSVGVGRLEEPVTLSRAELAMAETGTLVLTSGPDNPVTLAFLGETHFMVVRAADVMGGFEDMWAEIRRRNLDPRTINLITGPSRSGDIGQKISARRPWTDCGSCVSGGLRASANARTHGAGPRTFQGQSASRAGSTTSTLTAKIGKGFGFATGFRFQRGRTMSGYARARCGDGTSGPVRGLGQGLGEGEDFGYRFPRPGLCDDRRADDGTICDGGDGLGGLWRLDAESDHNRQAGGGLDAGNLGGHRCSIDLGRAGDAGDRNVIDKA